MREVEEREKQIEKIGESYTYTSVDISQDLDFWGQCGQDRYVRALHFFVNGPYIERTPKKDNRPLSESEAQKETDRVTKVIERAQKTPPDRPLDGPEFNITRVLEVMDIRPPRFGASGSENGRNCWSQLSRDWAQL